MAHEADDIANLRSRVEALETLVLVLQGRIDSLEAASGGAAPEFHMGDQEPTV